MPPSDHNGQLQSHLHAHTPCMHIIKNKNKSKIFYNGKSWVQMPVNSALKEIEAGELNVQGKSRLIQQALVSKKNNNKTKIPKTVKGWAVFSGRTLSLH